jgi:DNA-binding SARP family transcriptional activator
MSARWAAAHPPSRSAMQLTSSRNNDAVQSQVRILGPLEAWAGERRLELGGQRQLELFAFWVLHANQAVSNDALLDAVWEPGASLAKHCPTMAIARLRKARAPLEAIDGNGAALRTVGRGYLLTIRPDRLDASAFSAGIRGGREALDTADPMRAAELLRDTQSLWRGPPLAEVSFDDFAQAEIRRVEELRLLATETRIEAEMQLGYHAELIGELEAMLIEHPSRERVAAQLMLALYRSGRQTAALEVYQRARVHYRRR